MTIIHDPKLRALLAKERKPGTPGRWRRVLYQNDYWYIFEQRGSKLLLSKRPNDTAWVHKVDPREVVDSP
jgi:hypothetical protein